MSGNLGIDTMVGDGARSSIENDDVDDDDEELPSFDADFKLEESLSFSLLSFFVFFFEVDSWDFEDVPFLILCMSADDDDDDVVEDDTSNE